MPVGRIFYKKARRFTGCEITRSTNENLYYAVEDRVSLRAVPGGRIRNEGRDRNQVIQQRCEVPKGV